ncbi:hypothetical protein [Bacillus solitudinis]|nr:hypothetical protein [Bacillus solitudinis]
MTNIMDGMDAARFRSGNPNAKERPKQEKETSKEKKMPPVLKNLKNGS